MEKLLTAQEVAQRYSVTVESVWRWIRDGRLSAVALNKRNYRIRPADLEAFERGEVRAGGDPVPPWKYRHKKSGGE